jgi:hypothetical protein
MCAKSPPARSVKPSGETGFVFKPSGVGALGGLFYAGELLAVWCIVRGAVGGSGVVLEKGSERSPFLLVGYAAIGTPTDIRASRTRAD